MARALLSGLLAGLLLAPGLAPPARAHVPDAQAVAHAGARANQAAGRGGPVELEIEIFEGASREPVARGVLLLDPAGQARLEAQYRDGPRERQLWSRGVRRSSRDGVAEPGGRALLPPLYLLQADSSGSLRSGLSALGGRSGHVELGYDGARDAWVLGGRDGGPAVWVDTRDHAIFRIDWGTTRARLVWPDGGDPSRWPARIELEEAGLDPLRIEIRGAKPATPAPGAFDPDWLTH